MENNATTPLFLNGNVCLRAHVTGYMLLKPVSFSKNANIKLGQSGDVWSFSTCAGNGTVTLIVTDKDGNEIDRIIGLGTCNGICEKCGCWKSVDGKQPPCYVIKSYRNPSVLVNHINNSNGLRADIDLAFEQLDGQYIRARKKPAAIRWNQSGEMLGIRMWKKVIEFHKKHPEVLGWVYSKDYRNFSRIAKDLPENLHVLISVWGKFGVSVYKKWAHLPNVHAFMVEQSPLYDVPKSELKPSCHCGAYHVTYTKKGKAKITLNHEVTCDKCRLCFTNGIRVIGCLAH